MPFNLFNTLVNFQKYIYKMLAKKLDIFVIKYLEDIFINIEDLKKKHIKAVQ